MLFHFQEKRVDEFFELIEENMSKVNHYFQTVFRTFIRHKQYIKNALETDYSNAKLEATNKLIKDIKRLGFGFRNFKWLPTVCRNWKIRKWQKARYTFIKKNLAETGKLFIFAPVLQMRK